MTIGTGGQVFVPLSQPLLDPKLRIHTFCHAPRERWYLLGAMLSAGMALRWLRAILGSDRFSYSELDHAASEVEPGCEGLTFLPYIVGERSPIIDARAKGGFVGLALRHGPGHLVRALLEGIPLRFGKSLKRWRIAGLICQSWWLPAMDSAARFGAKCWRMLSIVRFAKGKMRLPRNARA